MNISFIKHRSLSVVFVATLALLTLTPLFASAAEFVPLAPIPNLDTSENATLGSYINSVFLLVISVSAMLAVIRIVIGGFQYMTQTASVTKTAGAINTIRDAVIGLLLLLGSFVILSTVNKEIVNLDALNFTKLGPSQETQDAIKLSDAEARAQQQRLSAWNETLKNPGKVTELAGIKKEEWEMDVTGLSLQEKRRLSSSCNKLSGRPKSKILTGTGGKEVLYCVRSI